VRGLYAIVDLTSLEERGLDVLGFLHALLEARPGRVQLRAKHHDARATLQWLRAFRGPCSEARVKLFANDRPDLAALAGADGVHLGQDDLPLASVRGAFPELEFGLSTHDPEQLRAALRLDPDYVAYGPVFRTGSKQRPDPVVGLDGLARAQELCRAAGRPLVAIGGIDLERAARVGALAEMGAVIGGLVPTAGDLSEVTRRARDLDRALRAGGKRA
jgi:thiamine-phosphate pyrophosphorylase